MSPWLPIILSRLTIRPLRDSDFGAQHAVYSDPQAVHVSTAAGSTATGSDRSPRSTGLAIRAGAPAVNTKLPHPRFRVPLIGDLVFVDVAKTCHRLVKEIERK
jgi:hypothetical protein